MNVKTETSLTLTRVINASPERVFDAWTRPDLIRQWSAPEGIDVEEYVSDLRVGGDYRLRMRTQEGNYHTAFGTFKEIQPGKRLVYTWDWEESDPGMGETRVTVEFNALGESTEVILTHEFFPDEKMRDDHSTGWTSCLNRLEALRI